MNSYLSEAFAKLDILNEDMFEADDDGIEKLKTFTDGDEDVVSIIDSDAENEEELEDSYIGKVVLDCCICHSKVYEDKENVKIDEEEELANVGEECPYCYATDGFKVIGEIKEFNKDNDDKEENSEEDKEEETETDEVEVEVDDKEEPIEESYKEGDYAVVISCSPYDDNGDIIKDEKVEWEVNFALSPEDDTEEYKDKCDKLKDKLQKATDRFYRIGEWKPYYMASIFLNKNKAKSLLSKGTGMWSVNEVSDMCSADNTLFYCIEPKKKGSANESLKKKSCNESITDDYKEAKRQRIRAMIDKKRMSKECPTCKKVDEAKRLPVKTFYYNVDGDDYVFSCKTASTRSGFSHICSLTKNGEEIASEKANYYNRTWESFEYESVIKKTIKKALKDGFIDESVAGQLQNKVGINESLENVTVTTDKEHLEMSSDENGKVTVTSEPVENSQDISSDENDEVEVIEPINKETEDEIELGSEEDEEPEDGEEIDVDVSDFDEDEFDKMGESYLKKSYKNVTSYKTESVAQVGNKLKVEGIITFDSGAKKHTKFMFEAKEITKGGKAKFLGENANICRGRKAFTLIGTLTKGKFIAESFNYNYKVKDSNCNLSKRVYGTIKRK